MKPEERCPFCKRARATSVLGKVSLCWSCYQLALKLPGVPLPENGRVCPVCERRPVGKSGDSIGNTELCAHCYTFVQALVTPIRQATHKQVDALGQQLVRLDQMAESDERVVKLKEEVKRLTAALDTQEYRRYRDEHPEDFLEEDPRPEGSGPPA